MRILIVNALYPPHRVGGAETSVALLAQALVRAGDEVTVATLDDIAVPTRTVESGVVVHRLPLDNRYWPFDGARRAKLERLRWHWRNRWNARAAARIGELIDAERPDIVHTHVLTGFSVAVWAEAKRRGVPLVHTLRDYAAICARSALFREGRTCRGRCADCVLLSRPAREGSQLVDRLIGNSDYLIAAHREAGYFTNAPARRIFSIGQAARQARPARAGDEPLVFGFIGRIEAEKGIEVVLQACARLTSREWRLRVAGSGCAVYVAGLRRRFPDPRIEWLGYSEAEGFYRSIDVLLVASIWPEPLPRTLIEAVSQGLSTICAEAGGIPEIAGLPRVSLSYPPTDSAALAAAMTMAIDHKPDWRLGGLKDPASLAVFSEANVVARHREVYHAARVARVR